MELSEAIIIAMIGVLGTLSLPVVRSMINKSTQNANVHVSNSKALSMLVSSIETLHDKIDTLDSLHRSEDSIFATKKLESKVDGIIADIAYLKGRSN